MFVTLLSLCLMCLTDRCLAQELTAIAYTNQNTHVYNYTQRPYCQSSDNWENWTCDFHRERDWIWNVDTLGVEKAPPTIDYYSKPLFNNFAANGYCLLYYKKYPDFNMSSGTCEQAIKKEVYLYHNITAPNFYVKFDRRYMYQSNWVYCLSCRNLNGPEVWANPFSMHLDKDHYSRWDQNIVNIAIATHSFAMNTATPTRKVTMNIWTTYFRTADYPLLKHEVFPNCQFELNNPAQVLESTASIGWDSVSLTVNRSQEVTMTSIYLNCYMLKNRAWDTTLLKINVPFQVQQTVDCSKNWISFMPSGGFYIYPITEDETNEYNLTKNYISFDEEACKPTSELQFHYANGTVIVNTTAPEAPILKIWNSAEGQVGVQGQIKYKIINPSVRGTRFDFRIYWNFTVSDAAGTPVWIQSPNYPLLVCHDQMTSTWTPLDHRIDITLATTQNQLSWSYTQSQNRPVPQRSKCQITACSIYEADGVTLKPGLYCDATGTPQFTIDWKNSNNMLTTAIQKDSFKMKISFYGGQMIWMTQFIDTSHTIGSVSETIWYGTQCGANSAIIGPGSKNTWQYKSHMDPDQAFFQIDSGAYTTNLVNCPVNRAGIKVVSTKGQHSDLEGVTFSPMDTSDRVFPLNRTQENAYSFRLKIPDANATYISKYYYRLDVGCVRKRVDYSPSATTVTDLVIDHEGRGVYEILSMTIRNEKNQDSPSWCTYQNSSIVSLSAKSNDPTPQTVSLNASSLVTLTELGQSRVKLEFNTSALVNPSVGQTVNITFSIDTYISKDSKVHWTPVMTFAFICTNVSANINEAGWQNGLGPIQFVTPGDAAMTKFVSSVYTKSNNSCQLVCSFTLDDPANPSAVWTTSTDSQNTLKVQVLNLGTNTQGCEFKPTDSNTHRVVEFAYKVRAQGGELKHLVRAKLVIGCVDGQTGVVEDPRFIKDIMRLPGQETIYNVYAPAPPRDYCNIIRAQPVNETVMNEGGSVPEVIKFVDWQSCIQPCLRFKLDSQVLVPKSTLTFKIQFTLGTTQQFISSLVTVKTLDCQSDSTKLLSLQQKETSFAVLVDSPITTLKVPGFNCSLAMCCTTLETGTSELNIDNPDPFSNWFSNNSRVNVIEVTKDHITLKYSTKYQRQMTFRLHQRNHAGSWVVSPKITINVQPKQTQNSTWVNTNTLVLNETTKPQPGNQASQISNQGHTTAVQQLGSSTTVPVNHEQKTFLQRIEENMIAINATKIEGIGYTFPGVNTSFMSQPSKKNVPPRFTFKPLTSNGEMIMLFDQEMVFPPYLTQEFYNSVFRLTFISYSEEVEKDELRFKEGDRTRQLARREAYWDSIIRVTNHTSYHMKLKLDFLQLEKVSRGLEFDKISITFLEPQFFISKESKLSIDVPQGFIVVKTFPPQIQPEVKIQIESIANKTEMVMNTVGTTSIIIQYMLGGSMQVFWGMMRALQMIVFNGLVNNPAPPNVSVFMLVCMEMAQFDLFDFQKVYEVAFEFKETTPLNEKYEFVGIESKNFMLNSGSFFPYLMIITVVAWLEWIMNKFALCFARYNCCRKIGTYIHQKKARSSKLFQYQKLFMEVYFDLALAIFLHLDCFIHEKQGLKEFFKQTDDKWCTCVVFLILVLVILFPIWAYWKINKSNISCNDQSYELFRGDYRSDTPRRANYVFFFIIRRICNAILLVFGSEIPLFQTIILFAWSLANNAYLYDSLPLKNGNKIELMNEIVIYIVALLQMNFMNIRNPEHLTELLGWILIGVVGLVMAMNLSLTFFKSFKTFLNEKKHQLSEIKVMFCMFLRCIKPLKHINNNEDQQSKEELETVKFIKTWHEQRNWLKANNVNLGIFFEEVRYQQFIKENKSKAYVQRLNKVVNYLATKQTHRDITLMKVKQNLNKTKYKELILSHINNLKVKKTKKKQDLVQTHNLRPEEKPLRTHNSWLDLSDRVIKNKQVLKIVQKSKALQMLVIEESDNESCSAPPSLRTIYNQNIDKLLHMPKLNSINKLNKATYWQEQTQSVFEINDEERKSQLAEDGAKPMITKEKLYEEKNTDIEEKPRGIQNNKLDLTFILDQGSEEYGDELEEQLRNDPGIMQQFHKNDGICMMLDGGANDYMQAVLQCFLRLEPFASFFMQRVYNEGKARGSQMPLCTLLTNIFNQANADQIFILKGMAPEVDLQELQDYLKDDVMDTQGYNDAAQFMAALMLMIQDELGISDDLNSRRAKAFKKMVCLKQTQYYECFYQHRTQTQINNLVSSLELPANSSLGQALIELFQPQVVQRICSKCEDESLQDVDKQTQVSEIPDILILHFDSFAEDSTIKPQFVEEVPYTFLVRWLFPKESVIDKSKNCAFELMGLVDLQGSSLNDSKYTTYVQRKSKTKKEDHEWLSIHKQTKTVVDQDTVLMRTNPQILVYQKVQQQ